MKKIRTEDAVGTILCHDVTRIIKDEVKERAFKKGHLIRQEDVERLLDIGKFHLYVYELEEGMMHENDAALILAKASRGKNIEQTDISEGKIELIASCDGVLSVDVERLEQINDIDEVMLATRHNFYPVKKGDKLAGMRVIPLTVSKEKMEEVKKIANQQPLINVYPYHSFKCGIVTTGSEVYYGRIKDTFTPVLEKKLAAFNIPIIGHITVNDDTNKIKEAILSLKQQGADLILCTGGMSVDPDDLTPLAIKQAGVNIVSYGSSVLPGSQFLMGYFEDGTPIMGLPGAVMFFETTIFDLIFPRVVAKIPVTKKQINRLAHGGLCLNCKVCHYPHCEFGKGA